MSKYTTHLQMIPILLYVVVFEMKTLIHSCCMTVDNILFIQIVIKHIEMTIDFECYYSQEHIYH